MHSHWQECKQGNDFALTDSFVTTIRRKPELAFESVGGQTEAPSRDQVGTKSGLSGKQVGRRPESQPESLNIRIIRRLADSPLSKAELSASLGHKEISGQLNKIIRMLISDETIEYTIPETPNSRLQKYRLTEKGRTLLTTLVQKEIKK